MPAVTVDSILDLPRVQSPGIGSAPASGAFGDDCRAVFEGEGFRATCLAGVDLADLDPFIHMDQMGEVEYAPGAKGTPWHPHRGFETVTTS